MELRALRFNLKLRAYTLRKSCIHLLGYQMNLHVPCYAVWCGLPGWSDQNGVKDVSGEAVLFLVCPPNVCDIDRMINATLNG